MGEWGGGWRGGEGRGVGRGGAAAQRTRELWGAGTLVGLFAQGAQADRLQARREPLDQRAGRLRVVADQAREDLDRALALEGQLSSQAAVEHDPQREHVGLGVDLAVQPLGLLRRHVGRGPEHLAGDRLVVVGAVVLGDAEVDELHRAVVAAEDVLRADVAVHDAQGLAALVGALVGEGQRLEDLAADEQGQLYVRYYQDMAMDLRPSARRSATPNEAKVL